MSGAGFWRTYLRIVFPLMAQTMVMVGVIKFMFAAQHNSGDHSSGDFGDENLVAARP